VLGIFLALPVAAIQCWPLPSGSPPSDVYAIAALVRERRSILVLVLAGVVVGSLQAPPFAPEDSRRPLTTAPAIVFWLLGSLSAIRRAKCGRAPLVALGLVPLWRALAHPMCCRWATRSQGDGVEAGRLRLIEVAAATLMTAQRRRHLRRDRLGRPRHPHIARMAVGPSFDRLLPTAMLLGASYLLLVDTLAAPWRASRCRSASHCHHRRAVLPMLAGGGGGRAGQSPPCWRRTDSAWLMAPRSSAATWTCRAAGEVLCLLGPTLGKTRCSRRMLGLLLPQAGEVPVSAAREWRGDQPQDRSACPLRAPGALRPFPVSRARMW